MKNEKKIAGKYIPLPANPSLDQAKTYIKQNIKEGVKCPCCNGYVKVYNRSINSANAICLIELFKISEKHGYRFYHINELKELSKKFMKMVNGGEFARMRHYGFIMDQPKSDDKKNKKTSGYWILTTKGKKFVKGEIEVYKNMLILNNNVLGYEGDMVNISDCLDEQFDYEKIMSGFQIKGKPSSTSQKLPTLEQTLFSNID